MCLLCDDEAAYQAYMAYLDAMEKQGASPDLDKAMDAALAVVAQNDKARLAKSPAGFSSNPLSPHSPFSCDPVDE